MKNSNEKDKYIHTLLLLLGTTFTPSTDTVRLTFLFFIDLALNSYYKGKNIN